MVEAARDTFNQNDRADANTIVKGEPRVLVVKGDEEVAAQLVAALKTERQNVDTVIPEALPSDLAGLADYDSVVLVDVPRLRLTDKALAALQVYVRDLGRGLVTVGGPRAYGAGGYTDTPLEETLPVDMGVRDREKQPDVALVVVIDKSGSMDACHCNSFNGGMNNGGAGIAGVKKTDIGKEAILRAAAALTAQDEFGVVAFDSAAHWVVKTGPLGGVTDLQSQLNAIVPDGQTNIFAGLDQAVSSLKTATATRRHIILLTDGWSSSGQYDQILKDMKAAGITLSTVGAGGGANPFLQQLARNGGGRFYDAANPASIPDIFLKETQQVSGQQIVEEKFFPILTSSSPILRGIDGGFPSLLGYNGTTAKPAAQTVLVTARDDPLLAQWQYGLGRSVAWMSDSTGRWAKSWIGWDGFSTFFSQMVGWTFPGEESGGIEASFLDRGGRTYLRVESVNEDGSARDFYKTQVALVGPDLATVDRGPEPGRAGRLRVAGDLARQRRVRRQGHPDQGRVAVARADARPRGADAGRVPAAGRERAADGGDAQCDRRPRARPPRRCLGPRPADDEPVHGPVAAAAGRRAAPVAAGHRAPAGVVRPARARRRSCLGLRPRPRTTRVPPHPADRGPVRRTRTCGFGGRPLGDHAPGRRAPGRGSRGHAARADADPARQIPRPRPCPSRRRQRPCRRPRRPHRRRRPSCRRRRHPRPRPPRRRPPQRPRPRATRWPACARQSAARGAERRSTRAPGANPPSL